MINIYNVDKKIDIKLNKNISCIGFFDGVHLGHQALIKKTVDLASQLNIDSTLITFYPDPSEIISNTKIKHINTLNQRIKIFEKLGIKNVVVINFDERFRNLSPDDFINKYLNKLNIETLILGFDFRFGKNGYGNYDFLLKNKHKRFSIIKVDEVKYYGKKISSTRIRKAIENNKYNIVNRMLGYKYK